MNRTPPPPGGTSSVRSAPAHAFPPRALRKWCAENLTLRPGADGGLEAVFRLEGSTCGNVPFLLDYRVRLAPATDGHRILALACAPAPGDDNHREMCSAKADLDALSATLRDEQPLLGQPLADALAWQSPTNPDGCLCAAPSRAHKWRAVLHTLHFALRASP